MSSGLLLFACGGDPAGDPPTEPTDGSTGNGASTGSTGNTSGATGSTTQLATDSSGDSSSGSTAPPGTSSESGTPEEPLGDRVVLQTGDALDGAEVGRIYSWGIADEDLVRARVSWVEGSTVVGDALVEAPGVSSEVATLATPEDVTAATGQPTLQGTLHDSQGFIAATDDAGCIQTFDFGFGQSLCPNDPKLDPGGVPFLYGLSEGTALVEVQRPQGTRFEVIGLHVTDPLTVFLDEGAEVPGTGLSIVNSIGSLSLGRNGAFIQAAGRTQSADSAAGLVFTDGGTKIVVSDVGTGTTTGGQFPGGALGDEVVLTGGRLFRGATQSVSGIAVFAFVPTDQAGNLHSSAGIYSYDPQDMSFVRHLDFNASLFDGEEESPIIVQGVSPAFPLVSFGATLDGRIVMVAELENGTVGVFREREPEVFINIATTRMTPGDDEGLFIEGATYADVGSVVMGDDGSLMFTARIEGKGFEGPLGLGVWGHGPDNAEVAPRLLARFGDRLPEHEDEATIERIQIADQIVVPDQAGTQGIFRRRTVPGVSGEELQIFGTPGSSRVIRAREGAGECSLGLVHVQGGDRDLLMMKRLSTSCEE